MKEDKGEGEGVTVKIFRPRSRRRRRVKIENKRHTEYLVHGTYTTNEGLILSTDS